MKGTAEVWGAVVASTLTTLAVFVPVLFVQEEAGQLFRDIALAISAAVGLSMIVSVTVIPLGASRLLRKHKQDTGGAKRPRAHGAREPSGRPRRAHRPRVLDRLRAEAVSTGSAARSSWSVVSINRALQSSFPLRLTAALLAVGGSIYFSWRLLPKVEYLPTGNRNLVFGLLVPPPGYNIDALTEMGSLVESQLEPYWDFDRQDPKIASMKYPAIGDFFYIVRGRQVFIGLRALDPERASELIPLVKEATAKLPGTFALVNQSSLFERGVGAGRSIDVEITGPELAKLVELGGHVLTSVATVIPDSQARPVPSLDLSSPELHVIPKREQAADMAMTAVELGYTVNALVDGAYAGDFYHKGDKIDLTIIGRPESATRTQDLAQLPVAVPSGELATLEHVARIELTSGPEQINRRERQRAITIAVSPPPGNGVGRRHREDRARHRRADGRRGQTRRRHVSNQLGGHGR